jgi:predicted methyltransferase
VVVTLDLLHHIPADVAEVLIRQVYEALAPGGIFLIKDVDTRPLHKLLFTYLLDVAMMPRLSVHYRDAASWRALLQKAGFAKVWHYPLRDYLPYPHMLLVAQKPL